MPTKTRTFRCKHQGCPATYIASELMQKHEDEPHFKCECGRHFTAHGRMAHLGQYRRRGLNHPELKKKGDK